MVIDPMLWIFTFERRYHGGAAAGPFVNGRYFLLVWLSSQTGILTASFLRVIDHTQPDTHIW
jgi:hypothetical protein